MQSSSRLVLFACGLGVAAGAELLIVFVIHSISLRFLFVLEKAEFADQVDTDDEDGDGYCNVRRCHKSLPSVGLCVFSIISPIATEDSLQST